MKLKIKICGMADEQNIADTVALSPHYLGFIFYDKSPRNALSLTPSALEPIPNGVKRVGVFVDESFHTIISIAEQYHLSSLQLHGNESPQLCEALRREGYEVLKAVGITSAFQWHILAPYLGSVDLFLFDTHCRQKGGSGKKFNWDELQNYPFDTPFLLSGGISIDDVATISQLRHPSLTGIDINSRFELSPGIKNVALIKELIDVLTEKSALAHQTINNII